MSLSDGVVEGCVVARLLNETVANRMLITMILILEIYGYR